MNNTYLNFQDRNAYISKYSTLEFIEDLRNELQKYSEELALVFPNRVKKYSNRALSRLWVDYNDFIKNLKRRKIGFEIEEGKLEILKKKLIKTLNFKSVSCLGIIQKYKNHEIDMNVLFSMLTDELGRVSGNINVTNEEMGLILQGTSYYIHDLIFLIRTRYPNYRFSLERLIYMEKNIKLIFGEKSRNLLKLIKKYKEYNPDLKDYPKQQYTITNPSFFREIDTVEKAYWFGFLHADGWLDINELRIGLELSVKDKAQVIAWAKIMGLDISRLKERTRFVRYKGEIKKIPMVFVRFVCKPMAIDLYNLGFLELKNGDHGLPDFVKSAIQSKKYRLAHAWLLGFFDGDGTLKESKKVARIYSSNKILLDEIKHYFNIGKYDVLTNHKGQLTMIEKINSEGEIYMSKPQYSLHLGWDLLESLLKSFKGGLQRKRPFDR